ncbi:hypothetical protein LSAT2_029259 [Lamellibrachia satsuma]|nr:hypothetical protein LSAT2_029259 [Lamellibrachia satsuma]
MSARAAELRAHSTESAPRKRRVVMFVTSSRWRAKHNTPVVSLPVQSRGLRGFAGFEIKAHIETRLRPNSHSALTVHTCVRRFPYIDGGVIVTIVFIVIIVFIDIIIVIISSVNKVRQEISGQVVIVF